MGRPADLVECPPSVLAEPLEAGELRLDRDTGWPGDLDQAIALLVDGHRRALGGVAKIALWRRLRRQRARVGIKPQTDLAAALLDERRQTIGEGARPVSRRP
jgi:hypothetical protein